MRSWCGAAVGKREITKLFQVVVVAGRGGGRGGAAAGLQRYPLGPLQKLQYLDIGHRGNEQNLILSFTLFYLDMYAENFCHFFYNSRYPGMCLKCSLAVSAGGAGAGHS